MFVPGVAASETIMYGWKVQSQLYLEMFFVCFFYCHGNINDHVITKIKYNID